MPPTSSEWNLYPTITQALRRASFVSRPAWGRYALCDAQFDDESAGRSRTKSTSLWSASNTVGHREAKRSKFPEPTNDVVAIAQAIIEDEDLPIDKTRVVLGGFSAGGNIALSAAQMPELKNMISGVVCWYPITDCSLTAFERQNSRPYCTKDDLGDLRNWMPVWTWAYLGPGQDLRGPLLSVRYARVQNVPKWIYMIGAEYDMFANEARDTIFALAGLNELERKEGLDEFSKGTCKWKLVKNVRHGFTHNLMKAKSKDVGVIERMRTEQMLDAVGEWLYGGPFATDSGSKHP